MVELSGTEDKYPAELSGGMRKRVGIARAIALKPRYILYDEPTSGLDPVTSAVMDQLMVRTRDLGVTGLVVTHDMRSAFCVGDRIAMLDDGRIRQVGHQGRDPGHHGPGSPPVHRGTPMKRTNEFAVGLAVLAGARAGRRRGALAERDRRQQEAGDRRRAVPDRRRARRGRAGHAPGREGRPGRGHPAGGERVGRDRVQHRPGRGPADQAGGDLRVRQPVRRVERQRSSPTSRSPTDPNLRDALVESDQRRRRGVARARRFPTSAS